MERESANREFIATIGERIVEPAILEHCVVDAHRHRIKKWEAEQRGEVFETEKLDLAANQNYLKELFLRWGYEVPEGEVIDVYNPSGPVIINHGEEIMAARAEFRSDAETSHVIFYKKNEEGNWEHYQFDNKEAPEYKLEDPTLAIIDGKIIFSGVKPEFYTALNENGIGEKRARWHTVFYEGNNIQDLNEMDLKGPMMMKDIRMMQRADGKIVVYTRPQENWGPTGVDCGKGQIGCVVVNSMNELTTQKIKQAPLINIRFPKNEWGGINSAKQFAGDWNLLLGHRAFRFEQIAKKKFYYPFRALHNPLTGEMIYLGILAERIGGRSKTEELESVYFSSDDNVEGTYAKTTLGGGDCEIVTVRGPVPLEIYQFSSSVS